MSRTHTAHMSRKEDIVQTLSDSGVVVVGAAAVTVPYWSPFVEWVPGMVQGIIVVATLVFAVVRATNEVVRFVRSMREKE